MVKKEPNKEMEENPLPPKPKSSSKRISKKRLEVLKQYKQHAQNNEIEIVGSSQCGCFFCRHVYDARLIQDWLDNEEGVSAICPECGMDTVIGDASGIEIDKSLMKEMNLAFYGEANIDSDPEAARTYVSRYKEGEIVHKEKTEGFYIHYLRLLEEKENDPMASATLGELYQFGSQYTPIDLDEALSHYQKPQLRNDANALNSIGTILLEKMDSPEQTKAAFDCFVRSCAFGNLEGVLHLGECYLKGLGVPVDQETGFEILARGSAEAYTRFVIERKDWTVFPEFCLRVAECYIDGKGTSVDDGLALRYFLLAEFAHNIRTLFEGRDKHPATSRAIESGIFRLSKIHGLKRGNPVYDIDSFEDSSVDFSLNGHPKYLENPTFDEENHVLEFDLVLESPNIFLDMGNLYCGLVNGKLHFSLDNVASFKMGRSSRFTKIEGDYDEGYRFIDEDDGNEAIAIAEIGFIPDPEVFKKN